MEGLRVFVDPDRPETGDAPVFYSRRSNGPLYRWAFAQIPNRWRARRMNSSELTTRELAMLSWKNVPTPLQNTLAEHYQE